MIHGCALGHHFGRWLFFLTPASTGVELSGAPQKTYPPGISLGCEIGPDEFMLVINAGSGNFKFGLFDASGQETLTSGVIDESEPLAPKASWLDSRSLTWGKHPIVTAQSHRLP
jgi:hypothetical protein